MHEFYAEKGIISGKEPIQVDLDSLDLDLDEEEQIEMLIIEKGDYRYENQTVTLEQITQEVIKKMNELIQNKSDQASIKGKRYFLLKTSEYPFTQYDQLGRKDGQLWLERIIQALVDKEYIFKLDHTNGNGYYIQA